WRGLVVRVQDEARVLGPEAMRRELVLELLLFADPAGHAEPLHDLGARRSGVDKDGIVTAQDERAPGLRTRLLPHVARENQEARLELDVDQVEKIDLECHRCTS